MRRDAHRPCTAVLACRYRHAPGHTPGSLAILHNPSGVLYCSDVVGADPVPLKRTQCTFGGGVFGFVPGLLPYKFASLPGILQSTAVEVISQEDYRVLLPYHWFGGWFTKEEALAWARSVQGKPAGVSTVNGVEVGRRGNEGGPDDAASADLKLDL
jgi:hypothetical protein